jgi:hypothetical protein
MRECNQENDRHQNDIEQNVIRMTLSRMTLNKTGALYYKIFTVLIYGFS